VENKDPNTFDRTLVTVKNGNETFASTIEAKEPCSCRNLGRGLPEGDARDYAAIEAAVKAKGAKTSMTRCRAAPSKPGNPPGTVSPGRSRISISLGLMEAVNVSN
jgi:hypothetical protein